MQWYLRMEPAEHFHYDACIWPLHEPDRNYPTHTFGDLHDLWLL